MNKKNISDMHRCNRAAMIAYSTLIVILILAYLIEVIKGSRTIGYFVIFCLLALIPQVVCAVVYLKNKDTNRMKYAMAMGFSVFYLFTIFTTISPVAYVYAILVAVVLLCYDDLKLMLLYMIVSSVGNIVQVAVMAIQGQLTSEDLPNVEIRVISMILLSVFFYVATLVINQNNQGKMRLIEAEKEKTDALMQQILAVSERLTDDIQVVSEKMEVLGMSANKTRNSMEEVAQGTGEAVDTIQLQLEKTEEIQQTVKKVTDTSESITAHVEDTRQELNASQKNIDSLIQHVALSNEANENVSRELDELYKYTNQMQSIVQMINGVAEQTSLLSLNASIEAARAGEAGRGFAVVASEISSLATQTQDATIDITSLINNISAELSEVVQVIERMIKNAEEQNAVANTTAESFDKIANKNRQVYEETKVMSRLVLDLAEANKTIIKGIETISSVTEEVTAHSSETLETTEENSTITDEVGMIVTGLNQLAHELRVSE